jgi:hypothetical protein
MLNAFHTQNSVTTSQRRQPMSIIKTIWSTLFRITAVLTVQTLQKRTNVRCRQNETSLNVSEDCTWTTPASMAVCVEIRNLGNTKRINKVYNLPATNYLKVFYITHVLTKINFLLCKISVLAFTLSCLWMCCFQSHICKTFFNTAMIRNRVNLCTDMQF